MRRPHSHAPILLTLSLMTWILLPSSLFHLSPLFLLHGSQTDRKKLAMWPGTLSKIVLWVRCGGPGKNWLEEVDWSSCWLSSKTELSGGRCQLPCLSMCPPPPTQATDTSQGTNDWIAHPSSLPVLLSFFSFPSSSVSLTACQSGFMPPFPLCLKPQPADDLFAPKRFTAFWSQGHSCLHSVTDEYLLVCISSRWKDSYKQLPSFRFWVRLYGVVFVMSATVTWVNLRKHLKLFLLGRPSGTEE